MCDYTRRLIMDKIEDSVNDVRTLHFVAITDVNNFLLRTKKMRKVVRGFKIDSIQNFYKKIPVNK